MPEIVKIGYTERSVEERLKEANSSNTFKPPTPFVLEYYVEDIDAKEKEKMIHELIDSKRVNKKREYFKITIQEIKIIFDLIKSKKIYYKNLCDGYKNQIDAKRKMDKELQRIRDYNNIKIFIFDNFVSSTNNLSIDKSIEHFKNWFIVYAGPDSDSPPYKMFINLMSKKYGDYDECGFHNVEFKAII